MVKEVLHVKDKLELGLERGVVDPKHRLHELLLIYVVVALACLWGVNDLEESLTEYTWQIHVLY